MELLHVLYIYLKYTFFCYGSLKFIVNYLRETFLFYAERISLHIYILKNTIELVKLEYGNMILKMAGDHHIYINLTTKIQFIRVAENA